VLSSRGVLSSLDMLDIINRLLQFRLPAKPNLLPYRMGLVRRFPPINPQRITRVFTLIALPRTASSHSSLGRSEILDKKRDLAVVYSGTAIPHLTECHASTVQIPSPPR